MSRLNELFSDWISKRVDEEPLTPGIYHTIGAQESPVPYRLHLRIEPGENGVLLINAATILHLNPTATMYALQLINGASVQDAARNVARRFRVSKRQARRDYDILRQKILTLATNPDVDPVLFLDLDRSRPYEVTPSAPYRMDLALTYSTNPDGELDPHARARVDRELMADEWEKVLRTLWDAGIPHVTFTGGEPTRRNDLAQLIAFAEDLGQVTGVLTDGRRLSDAEYVESLSQAGLDHFLVVYHPQDPKSLSGIENALASDVYTAIHLTLNRGMASEVLDWLNTFAAMGATAVSLGGDDEDDQVHETLLELRESVAELDLDLVWNLPVPSSQINPMALEIPESLSGAGKAWLYVEPDGDVLPQQGVDRILGNILSDPWQIIWENARKS